MNTEKKDIITLNGYPDDIKEKVVEILIKKYFKHYTCVSHHQITQDLHDGKTIEESLRAYGEEGKNIFITSGLGYLFSPDSFKVFFIGREGIPYRNAWMNRYGTDCLDERNYDYTVSLVGKIDLEEIAERITFAYGKWERSLD